jgi:hypothetical protein
MRAVEFEHRRAKLGQIRRASDLDEDLPSPLASDAHPTGSTPCRRESGHSWSY